MAILEGWGSSLPVRWTEGRLPDAAPSTCLLNEWTTPIGSAVFAIPPGCVEGGYIGDTLL